MVSLTGLNRPNTVLSTVYRHLFALSLERSDLLAQIWVLVDSELADLYLNHGSMPSCLFQIIFISY